MVPGGWPVLGPIQERSSNNLLNGCETIEVI